MRNQTTNRKFSKWAIILAVAAATTAGCAGGPLTTREKGAGIGAVGGAAAGGLIGSAFGRPGMGAAIGAGLASAVALDGDHMQGQEQRVSKQPATNPSKPTHHRTRLSETTGDRV